MLFSLGQKEIEQFQGDFSPWGMHSYMHETLTISHFDEKKPLNHFYLVGSV